MSEVVQEHLGQEERCPYLPHQWARMRYRLVAGCSPDSYQTMLEHGWRRFGRAFFRPVCEACDACRSLRVEVERFRPDRSMRRTRRKNRDLELRVGEPSLTDDHLSLYNRYHADMARRKGWKEREITPIDYFLTFVEGYESFGRELCFLLDGRPVCIALFDLLPGALSAVYCYYDPQHRDRALGVQSVLTQVDLARQHGVPHLYLGYWIEHHPSMSYKAHYGPHQLLVGRPPLERPALWGNGAGAAAERP